MAGAAMGLGLLSYYIAGARTARSYADGDASAEQLAQDTGMLDDVRPNSRRAPSWMRLASAIAGADHRRRPPPSAERARDGASGGSASASRGR